MKVIGISTKLRGKQLEDALTDHDALVIGRQCVQSMEELRLALHLTRKAFEKKRNIARRMKYEFLLWLTGKTDLQGAFRVAKPKSSDMVLVVFSGDEKKIIDRLEAKTRKTRLETRAKPLDLERISLSRIRN